MNFEKIKSSNVLLNISGFSGGSGILDENSLDAQKAFEDINNRLDIVSESHDGFMTSADKIKLDNTNNTIMKMNFIYS